MATLDALCEQERIRESVPVRSPARCQKCGSLLPTPGYPGRVGDCCCRAPEPAGPTLVEQIAYICAQRESWQDWTQNYRLLSAVLHSLERLAREADDGR
jgi:hypothetical protein